MFFYKLYFWVIFTLISNLFYLNGNAQANPSKLKMVENITAQIYINDPVLNDLLIQGMEKGIQGNYTGAITDFTEVIQRDNLAMEAYYNRGIAYTKIAEYELAIADFNQALTLNPEAADVYVERAQVAEKLGNQASAISDLKKAIQLFKQQGNTYRYQEAQNLLRELQSSQLGESL